MQFNQILVLEDDAFQQRILCNILKKMFGGEIFLAENGCQALKAVESGFSPDLILCDLEMPDMDGIEFLRNMSGKSIEPLIVITSGASRDLIDSVVQMSQLYGINHITSLQKPVLQEDLERLIVEHSPLKTRRANSKIKQNEFSKDELNHALESGEIIAHYQPHICVKENRVVGGEALARWQSPVYGLLPPGAFLPKLIECGLSEKLFQVILKHAISDCARWQENGMNIGVSINATPAEIANVEFSNFVFTLLQEFNLAPQKLTIEVTEVANYENHHQILDSLSRLRLKGINVSIDDFGTGYSSMRHLIDGPFSQLKIDRSFVSQMSSSPKNLAAIKGMLSLAEGLQLSTVVEGVETELELQQLKALNCHLIQGYYYSKPLKESDFIFWCTQFNRSTPSADEHKMAAVVKLPEMMSS